MRLIREIRIFEHFYQYAHRGVTSRGPCQQIPSDLNPPKVDLSFKKFSKKTLDASIDIVGYIDFDNGSKIDINGTLTVIENGISYSGPVLLSGKLYNDCNVILEGNATLTSNNPYNVLHVHIKFNGSFSPCPLPQFPKCSSSIASSQPPKTLTTPVSCRTKKTKKGSKSSSTSEESGEISVGPLDEILEEIREIFG